MADGFSQPRKLTSTCFDSQELESSGKRRRFEIHPDAVQDALAILDAHPAHPNKKRRLSNLTREDV